MHLTVDIGVYSLTQRLAVWSMCAELGLFHGVLEPWGFQQPYETGNT